MMDRRLVLKFSLAGTASIFLPAGIANAATKIKPLFLKSGKIAANGYDPVAYFTVKKPVKGKTAHVSKWQGAEWRFSSAKNKTMFDANPAKYAPQYGGHCAFAMASGYIAPTVPEAWSVVNGKLYLNYSLGVRSRWEPKKASMIKSADKNWPKH